ncbi:hypothetical protein [Salipaludibacillus agaradhaerens]|nr:hypothetical protein [Salipaludibacillus agaradhaerens]
MNIDVEQVINELTIRIAQLERDNALLRVQVKHLDSKNSKEDIVE